ncbi:MAG: hypothetical protein WAM83_11630, partial [Bradyrhizobium sp.]
MALRFCIVSYSTQVNFVIASEAKQSRLFERGEAGLLRRFAPCNDGKLFPQYHLLDVAQLLLAEEYF